MGREQKLKELNKWFNDNIGGNLKIYKKLHENTSVQYYIDEITDNNQYNKFHIHQLLF